jgi:transposase
MSEEVRQVQEVLVRRQYPAEFKDRAAELCLRQGYSYGKAARELGVPAKTLANWVRERRGRPAGTAAALPGASAGPPGDSDNPAALKTQIRDLQKKLARSEMEKEILKKATAYFAKESL